MTLLAFSGLINFLACASMAYVVWKNRPEDPVARAYALFNCTVGFYSVFYFIWQLSHSESQAELFFKFLVVGIIWINQAYLHFIFVFLPESRAAKRKLVLYACVAANALFTYFVASGKLFSGVELRFNLGYWPKPTALFTIYLLFWHFECIYGFLVLASGFWRKELTVKQRHQLKYFVCAFAIGYFGGANNWPMWYGVHLPPYLNNLIAVYIGIIAYAILYHHLMDVRLLLRDTTLHLITATLLGAGCLMIGLPMAAINPFVGVVGSIVTMGLLMAFAYDPIRKALQPAIDRVMFANQFGYLEELSQLPNDILEFTNLNEMLKFLVTRLKEAAKLERVRIFMYDPGHQSYVETMGRLESGEESKEEPRQLAETDPLVQLLRSDNRLWTQEDFSQRDHQPAQEELKALQGAACFPVNKEKDLLGVVVLGRKRSGELFNQQDLKILQALRVRLENFLGQAMVITQEALNMVKDSHDMKNDVNALKGRVTWRAMRVAGWKQEFEKHLEVLNKVMAGGGAAEGLSKEEKDQVAVVFGSLRRQALEWFQEADRSRTIEDQAIQRLAHRLKNWAEYGRVVSEGFRGSRAMEAIDVGSAAQMSVERWLPHAEKKGLKLSISAKPGLVVWGERSLIEQVTENLIDNAIKATKQGQVDVVCGSDRDGVVLEIRDSGCGIPPEALTTIFEKPFYQGKGRETLEQSTGVGLYLVSQYVRSLGGRVKAESEVGKGSRFIVHLPRYEADKKGAAA